MFVMIFLIGTISAFEFDNVQDYDKEKREYTITNAFGIPFVSQEIAKIKLTSDLNHLVPRGYQKVAEFTIENHDDYINVFNDMEFYDLRKSSESFTRDFDYKYKTTIQVPNYENVCDEFVSENKTIHYENCRQEQIELRDQTVWEEINKETGLLKGNITIGIFTDVKVGDRVEWIPTLFGERLTEWSVWTESLNAQIFSYWKLDQTGADTNAIDSVTGTYNLTGISFDGDEWIPGLINNSVKFDGINDWLDLILNGGKIEAFEGTSAEYTINFWVNISSTTANDLIMTYADDNAGNPSQDLYIFWSAAAGIMQNAVGGGTQFTSVVGWEDSTWHMYTLVKYAGNVTIYGDSVINATSIQPGNAFVDNDFRIADDTNIDFFPGGLDEIGIWNRTLSQSEITQLYNGGAGITFISEFAPDVTLNSPIDAFNSSSQTINFNGTVASISTLANVTLFIDGVLNETNSSGINNVDYLFTKTISEGSHNWTYESCDDIGCAIATTRTFTIDTTSPIVTVIFPNETINFHEINTNLSVNWTVSDLNLDTCILEYEGTNTTVTCLDNSTNINITNSVNRSLILYVNDTFGNLNSSSVSWNYLVLQTSSTFNSSSFETLEERFTVNVTTNGSVIIAGTLTFDGIEHTGATITNPVGDDYSITKSITIPASIGTKNHNFNLTIIGRIINTTTQTQLINSTNLTICGAVPQNIPYINLTFKNETLSQEDITATISSTWIYSLTTLSGINKTLTFTDATENLNYTFCFSPSDRKVNIDLTMAYNNEISQQRTFVLTTLLSNATLTQVLFLLPTNLGLFSPFKTTNINGDTITNVRAVITRVIGAVTVTISSGFTDGSGFISFFLDPDETYTATFTKSPFEENTFSFTPAADLRNVIMGGEVAAIGNGTEISRGLTYQIIPENTTLANNTNVTFRFIVNSTNTITLMSMNITNSTNHQFLFVSQAGNGTITGFVDTGNQTKLIGIFTITANNETITFKRIWLIGNFFLGDYSLFRQLTLTKDNILISDFIRFILIIFTITATMIFLTRKEITDTSESKVIVATLLIWAFSLVGWLDTGLISTSSSSGITRLSQFSNQFGISIISSAFAFFFIFRRIFIRKL